ncbi:MAG: ribbon-helix-helix domain-containing protein [Pyrobaculum sp.]
MILISVHIPSALLQIVDDLVRQGVYPSRSEAIRDAIRQLLERYFYEAESQ